MGILSYIRRGVRLIVLCLIVLTFFKALFCCNPFDVLLLAGLILIFISLATGPC